MCDFSYDLTYNDLNPKFLFSCIQHQVQEEENYHCHDFIELAIILKGKGSYLIDNKLYPVTEGSVIIFNPGMYHKSIPDTEHGHTITACYLAFTNVDFINCPKGHFPLFADYQIMVTLPEVFQKELSHLCGNIALELKSCEEGRYFMLKSYLIQTICLLWRYQKQVQEESRAQESSDGYEFKSISKNYIIQQIMKYMEEHYQEKISLDKIAANMYLSSFYISKLFKSETGDTPINYLISLRMKKARTLLDKNPDASIQSVSASVGYEDAYHFSKLFKKYYGLSPLYYKDRITH
ncbi:MAG: AraC family transcriptional regulator [Lachnospiraceae bacterium]|nr:AraC family transcriptional regulator [Lachnospiraceae bacterium]MDD3617519.1 AraC family transcriptional regulator [Lachnospiraceae bacterium]